MQNPLEIGTPIEKINSKVDDTHRNGARGKVCEIAGQVPSNAPREIAGVWGYFVEWEDLPGVPVFIAGNRIRPVTIH